MHKLEIEILQHINDNPACVRGNIVDATKLDRETVGLTVARLRANGYITEPMFSLKRAGELTITEKGEASLQGINHG